MPLRTFGTRLAQAIDLRRAALALAGTIAVLLALGLAQRAGAPLSPLELDRDFSLPSLLTGALLLAGAGLALLLADTGPRAGWTLAAAAFAVFGVDELLYAHQRVEARVGGTWTSVFLPVVVVAGAVWVASARHARHPRARLGVLLTGIVWIASQALEGGLPNEGFAVSVVKPVLDLAAACALPLALVAELRARTAAPAAQERTVAVLDDFARELRPARLAAAIAAGILLLSAAGAIVGAGRLEAYFFDLNGEQTAPAAFSGALLFLAAAVALLLHATWPADRHGGRWWLLLGGVFAFLGVDEIGALHEKIQEATDIHPGQVVLLPLVVAAGLGWLVALRRMPSEGARNLWIAGAAVWVLSQAVDATQPPNRFVWSVVPEEALEMAGSALFVLALLAALRDRPGAVSAR